jgi:hypothetical protein
MAVVARRRILVAGILALALGVRLGEVARTSYTPVFDAGSYLTLASEVAHTGDYLNSTRSGTGAGGTRGPTAYFPPAYPYFLAAVDLIGGNLERRGAAVEPARISQAALGTVTVGLIGLVAYECFGWGVALAAWALAAIYPVLIELSAVLVVENLATALTLAAVWAALRARRARSEPRRLAWIAFTGLLTGLTALTHLNGIVIVLPLAFAAYGAMRRGAGDSAARRSAQSPAATALARQPQRAGTAGDRQPLRPRRRALAGPALLIAVTVLTILPWTIRNVIVMHKLIPISDETGITLVGTYNSASAHDRQIPYKWRYYLAIPRDRHLLRIASHLTEPQLSARLEHQALSYISRHPLSPLLVSEHNLLRMFELEGSIAWRTSAASIDLTAATARIGVYGFWALCLLALAGLALGGARRAPRWLWAVPVLIAISALPVNFETPRFREPIDPFILLLAAYAVWRALTAARGLLARGGSESAGRGRRSSVAGISTARSLAGGS